MQINIPFQESFREPMLQGRKELTSRTKAYGKPGDTFVMFDSSLTLRKVIKTSLSNVAYLCFRGEGFDTPEAFILCWDRLHPRKGYVPDQVVYLHFFQKEID